jgi:UDP:flavonoid glycosyltransferase YjiC (YdhE family)
MGSAGTFVITAAGLGGSLRRVRILFTCVVGHGHFNPMVPLARAFEAAGHRVAFATDPWFTGHVGGVGFEAFPAGLDMTEARRRFFATIPGWDEIAPWDQLLYIHPGLFAGVRIEPMLADLGRILPEWRPDLLVHDSAEMAGAMAAEQAAIPHVEHSFGVLRPLELRRSSTAALAPVAKRLGVANPGVGGINGELYLDVCPPGVQNSEIADLTRVQPLRPVGFDDAPGAVLPAWLATLGSRPLVYATMGTEFNKKPEIFRAILDGLADEPIDVVVTVGASGDPEALGSRAENVRVERFIPQSRLLPRCSAFVSHGGSGALLGTLNAGVPILAIPQGADQFLNADRIVETGIGLKLMPDELGPDAVRQAVRALVDDTRYLDAVRSHRASIDAMPPPDAVVGVLEDLVGKAQGGGNE